MDKTCKECGKTFSEKGKLKVHINTVHLGQKKYRCEICGAKFGECTSLRHHMRMHTGDKPFKCDICGKRFAQHSHLKTHTRIHTGEKPYVCSVCQKRFAETKNMNRHMRTHTGERFPCLKQGCDHAATDKSHLLVHMRRLHPEILHACATCGVLFADTDSLSMHNWKVHRDFSIPRSEKRRGTKLVTRVSTGATPQRKLFATRTVLPVSRGKRKQKTVMNLEPDFGPQCGYCESRDWKKGLGVRCRGPCGFWFHVGCAFGNAQPTRRMLVDYECLTCESCRKIKWLTETRDDIEANVDSFLDFRRVKFQDNTEFAMYPGGRFFHVYPDFSRIHKIGLYIRGVAFPDECITLCRGKIIQPNEVTDVAIQDWMFFDPDTDQYVDLRCEKALARFVNHDPADKANVEIKLIQDLHEDEWLLAVVALRIIHNEEILASYHVGPKTIRQPWMEPGHKTAIEAQGPVC